jgi:hypothetical protein
LWRLDLENKILSLDNLAPVLVVVAPVLKDDIADVLSAVVEVDRGRFR